MPDLLMKGLSAKVHRRLKETARRHHRSMNKEAIAILEDALVAPLPSVPDLKPFQGPVAVNAVWLRKAVQSGRA